MYRPHLILVPGLMCDATVWEHQTCELRAVTSGITIPEYSDARLSVLPVLPCWIQPADAWSVLSGHEEMVSRIPHSRLAVIEHSGHMSTMESPAEVTAAMRDWLTSL